MEYASGGELFDLLCQEIVFNFILILINNIYNYSLLKKKLVDYSNKLYLV